MAPYASFFILKYGVIQKEMPNYKMLFLLMHKSDKEHSFTIKKKKFYSFV